MTPSKIACISFTQNGTRLAEKIRSAFHGQVDVFTKDTYKSNLSGIFETYGGIIFISSTGIAVRLSAPFLQDKTHDPAVVVVDDLGRFAISLVSGHIGGANELARRIAEILNCQPIITTASDGRGIEAIDLFAQRHDLFIENLEDAKTITAMMVGDKPIKLISEIPVTLNYQQVVEQNPAGCIYVTSQKYVECALPHCLLRPKNLNVGIGCKRGKTQEEILKAIRQIFQVHNLSLNSIKTFATIDRKRGETGLLDICKTLQRPLKCFTKEEIQQVQYRFPASSLVQSKVGVSAVCEPCAYLAGGKIIVGKTIIDGVTVAVARE